MRRCRSLLLAGTALALSSTLGSAQDHSAPLSVSEGLTGRLDWATIDGPSAAALGLIAGLLAFAVTSAGLLVQTRRRAAREAAELRERVRVLGGEADKFTVLLRAEPQIIVSWPAAGEQADILGDTAPVIGAAAPQRILAFGTWLDAEPAQAMERALEALRLRGEAFSLPLTSQAGVKLEASGRAIGGRAVLRLRTVDGVEGDLAGLRAEHQALQRQTAALRGLIDALPHPVWVRDEAGALAFANPAFCQAVEAANSGEAAVRGLDLLGREARLAAAAARAAGLPYRQRLPAIAAGSRRVYDVLDMQTAAGSAGIALDATDADAQASEIIRLSEAHRRTLDQLATGVAIFDASKRLSFYNHAFRALWELDPVFLDQAPTDSAVLDELRAARKLPEEKDFREWKATLHEAYRSTEPREQLWHLPDGRARRVVTTPNAQGGVTYLFEDVTERFDLVRRYDSLIRVQGETLDHLGEAVAVFGSDGRVRLHNPAFARMWKLDSDVLAQRPHIEVVIDWCRALYGDETIWRRLRSTATAIEDRTIVSGRLERRDGTVVDLCTVPLPDGATLITFRDMTDSVNVERALRERNEALETADRLKVDFVHHVSYELRSPLTNIIGFAHFLGEPAIGPLNPKQHEYLGYINASTHALLAIINDILDLATIDAGAMKLNLGAVDIRSTMDAAAEGIRDRLAKDQIALTIHAEPDIGALVADERRLRQVLFNLLANAVGFSPAGSSVVLNARRTDDAVILSVTDNGPGIPPDVKDRVFDWFETHPLGSRHRGAGLGLSIVRSFVELHGGTVTLESTVGHGTTVTCAFPIMLDATARSAA